MRCPWQDEITSVVSGCARGADQLGERWAQQEGLEVTRFPAEWDRDGRAAGYMRNERMAREADALIAVWDGRSRGTGHMISMAKRWGLRVWVEKVG